MQINGALIQAGETPELPIEETNPLHTIRTTVHSTRTETPRGAGSFFL